ncbi:MAG: GAF domain-containing protein [Anaerolineae bacterium]|nr:GAF domain-containing protein [Anaerolineae bacterium]
MTRQDTVNLLDSVRAVISAAGARDEKLLEICRLLFENVAHYDWVGFYLVDEADDRVLVLGPFVGDPTEHTHIAFGEGICGQAAETEAVFIIQDVTAETNYLACSPHVKSEIVVPIFKSDPVSKHSIVVGELDVDSHAYAPFTDEDQSLLEAICAQVAALF